MSVWGVCDKGLVAEGAASVALWDKARGCPVPDRSVSSSTVDSRQDTDQPISKTGHVSVKTYSRKGRKHQTGGNKHIDKQEKEHQCWRKRRRHSMVEQIFPAAHGGLVPEQRKTVGEKEKQRKTVMDWL